MFLLNYLFDKFMHILRGGRKLARRSSNSYLYIIPVVRKMQLLHLQIEMVFSLYIILHIMSFLV